MKRRAKRSGGTYDLGQVATERKAAMDFMETLGVSGVKARTTPELIKIVRAETGAILTPFRMNTAVKKFLESKGEGGLASSNGFGESEPELLTPRPPLLRMPKLVPSPAGNVKVARAAPKPRSGLLETIQRLDKKLDRVLALLGD